MNIRNFQKQEGMDLAQTANKDYWRHFSFFCVVLCHFYAYPMRFFGVGLWLFC